jgi:transposase
MFSNLEAFQHAQIKLHLSGGRRRIPCRAPTFSEKLSGHFADRCLPGYDKVGGPGMVHAGCWTHARRGFANVVKLNPGDPVASPIVARINQLFAVDGEAREQGLSLEARHQLRQQKAPELLEKIKTAIEAARAGALPGGLLAKACQYTLGHWPRLTCFLQCLELELSTNLAENSMRPITLGRKNWIHIGSP